MTGSSTLPFRKLTSSAGCTPEIAQRGPSEHGDGELAKRFRSVRFARYSAQEVAAASESLLFGTLGDIDQRIPGIWATRRWHRSKSAGTSSATKKAAPSW